MTPTRPIFVYLLTIQLFIHVHGQTIDLNGEWTVSSENETHSFKGVVPGDVQSDLLRNGIIENPLLGDNNIKQRWIARQDWTYRRNFTLSNRILLTNARRILVFDGIDTVASVYLNGELILEADNQFLQHSVDVSHVLSRTNELVVVLHSPLNHAEKLAERYQTEFGHELPPSCPPAVIHGECHVNFLRKAQYSFGWDWGPAVPTMGIWKPVRLVSVESVVVESVSWTTKREESVWRVTGDIAIFRPTTTHQTEAKCTISVDRTTNTTIRHVLNANNGDVVENIPFQIVVPRNKVKEWWPAGEGQQHLYNISVECGTNVVREEIGFRHVELIEEFIDPRIPGKGRNFYFKVNDRPVFLKGSNWIPSSMFLSTENEERTEFLLDSAAEVGMNALRVWGGGVYETEHFYQYANRKGILLWQDLMFACALYPTTHNFAENVKKELRQQVTRLRKHASVLLFAGDNELEVAIRTHWWPTTNYSEKSQVSDYLQFRRDVFSEMMSLDGSRPFVASSPSNGRMGEKTGSIPTNPGDPRNGDIHFYNEFINLWQDSVYQTPRCATEYGVQSMPFRNTMLQYINESDWLYSSTILSHRQHHRAGVLTNLLTVFSHFPIIFECGSSLSDLHKCPYVSSNQFMDRYAFFSQAHQAIAYKVQTEHYRRFRNRLTKDGLGNTMCALFWQLNDVWAAPTWSSIDVNLNWKLVQYEARRFFAPVMVSLYTTSSNSLGITVLNDTPNTIKAVKLQVRQLSWENGFEPIFQEELQVEAVALTATEYNHYRIMREYDSDFVYTGQLFDSSGEKLGPESVLLPDKFFEVDFGSFGDVSIRDFRKIDNLTYEMTVHSTSLSPFTWITVEKEYLGWFSDNGFTMTSDERHIKIHLKQSIELQLCDVHVCNLRNCGKL